MSSRYNSDIVARGSVEMRLLICVVVNCQKRANHNYQSGCKRFGSVACQLCALFMTLTTYRYSLIF